MPAICAQKIYRFVGKIAVEILRSADPCALDALARYHRCAFVIAMHKRAEVLGRISRLPWSNGDHSHCPNVRRGVPGEEHCAGCVPNRCSHRRLRAKNGLDVVPQHIFTLHTAAKVSCVLRTIVNGVP